MKTALLIRARRCFNSDLVPHHINRANRRAWIRSLRQLGGNWVLTQPVAKESK